MKKEQSENLVVGEGIYCKRHPGKSRLYWYITHIFPDCVWVDTTVVQSTGTTYCAKRAITIRSLEKYWEACK